MIRKILIDIVIVLPIVAVSVYGLSPWMGIWRASGIGTCLGFLALEYRKHREGLRDEKKQP
jgi:hypothetical protein